VPQREGKPAKYSKMAKLAVLAVALGVAACASKDLAACTSCCPPCAATTLLERGTNEKSNVLRASLLLDSLSALCRNNTFRERLMREKSNVLRACMLSSSLCR
jgi:hypothetical protein